MYGQQNIFLNGFCVFALLMCGDLSLAIGAESVAMVTDLEGKAIFVGDARQPALSILSEVQQNSRVQFEKGARATIIYLKSSQEYELTGPSIVRFGTTHPLSLSGAIPKKRGAPLFASERGIHIKPVRVAQAAIVMRGVKSSSKIKLLNLNDTRTLEVRPIFTWQEIQPASSYLFRLLDDAGNILHESSVAKPFLELPKQIQLKEALDYTWVVSAKLPNGEELSNAGDFSLATPELREQVEILRPKTTAPLSERVAFAAWLEQMELRDEAREYWKNIAMERSDNPRLKALAEE